MNFTRKKIRIDAFLYRGKGIYFLTICCRDRRPVFAKLPVGLWLVKWLTRSAATHSYAVHAYCVMPDHVHLLAEGTQETCHVARFISDFKQRTAYPYRQRLDAALWQPRYYDHILRHPAELEGIAWYIWTNPIRKGLCRTPQDYPLSGSLTFDWKQRCSPAKMWTPPWKKPPTP